MKPTVFIFVPVEATREGFAKQLRECLDSLEEPSAQESKIAPEPVIKKQPESKPQPFWSWFISNPRPKKS